VVKPSGVEPTAKLLIGAVFASRLVESFEGFRSACRDWATVKVDEATIFLIVEDGSRKRTVSFLDVLLAIKLKKPRSNYSSSKEALAKELAKEEMFNDFKHKAFGEKVIDPMSSDHGVIFYERPYEEEGDVSNFGLYLPEVFNSSEGEPLMFFELELGN